MASFVLTLCLIVFIIVMAGTAVVLFTSGGFLAFTPKPKQPSQHPHAHTRHAA